MKKMFLFPPRRCYDIEILRNYRKFFEKFNMSQVRNFSIPTWFMNDAEVSQNDGYAWEGKLNLHVNAMFGKKLDNNAFCFGSLAAFVI